MRVVVTGTTGVVGEAIRRVVKEQKRPGFVMHTRADCDLMDFAATKNYFAAQKPDAVVHLAARVYGIQGNMDNKGVSFFENAMINSHVVEAARLAGVRRFVGMGTGAVYPEFKDNSPLVESQIWLGPPHGSEDSYAHAKRAMLAQLEAYKEQYGLDSAFVVSCNIYGPHDRFDPKHGHVVPSLVAKFDEAARIGQNVTVWGDGSAIRDFLYADDCASAVLTILDSKLTGAVNIGSGRHIAIRDVVEGLVKAYDFAPSRVIWDKTKPNGQAVRVYDLKKLMSTGFIARYSLEEGLKLTSDWYSQNRESARR
jgi:GDP-L-fucose synthase